MWRKFQKCRLSTLLCLFDCVIYIFISLLHCIRYKQLILLHCIRYSSSVSFTTFATVAQSPSLHSKWPLQWRFSLLSTTTSGRMAWRCNYAPKYSSDLQWRQRQSQSIMLTKKSTGIGLMKPMDACLSQSLEIFSSTSRDWRLPRKFGTRLPPYLINRMR